MNWSHDIPKLDRAKSLDLERTPGRGRFTGIVTSLDWIGAFTHYYGGRTNPCQGEGCEICEKKIGKRWHGYLGVWQPKAHRHCLFEFTALAAEHFQRYVELTGGLRGCSFVAERRGVRSNAPVTISCSPSNLEGVALPHPPDIKNILAIIWGLPEDSLERTGGYAYSELVQPDVKIMDEINGPAKDVKARRKLST